MGRAAKYYTLGQKTQARKASKRRYAATDKGKEAIARQNSRAYQRRIAASATHTTLQPSSDASTPKINAGSIPQSLLLLFRQPIPSTHLFRLALQDAENVDESELGVWDASPPYETLQAHEEDAAEVRFTGRIVEVMHGKRLRELRVEDEERVSRVRAGQCNNTVKGLEERIEALSLTCHQDAALIASELPGSKRDKRMAEFHLEWAAKQLCVLSAELAALQKSPQHFLTVYSEGRLGWRSVIVEVES